MERSHSTSIHLKRVTAWVFRTVDEICTAEAYWISLAQRDNFPSEVQDLEAQGTISSTSPLLTLRPLLDSNKILRVGGRQQNSAMVFSRIHPIILPKKHPTTKLIVWYEHSTSTCRSNSHDVFTCPIPHHWGSSTCALCST
jgi:hypothetical protein